ncbi:cytochrome P450 [Streptomyces abyssalis]|uniref:cytochrome P450 n=1 Tax=Streptomyces abyssalis TaxID=933944 RepID=UPI00085C3EB7|nr:cytochrome P450 [Streptomyces abyssalis]
MTSSPLSGPDAAASGCPAHRAGGSDSSTAGPGPGSESGLPKLYDDDFAADPGALYARLRSQSGPAQWVELAPGVESILVTGYQAALEVLRSPYFSKDAHRWKALADGRVPSDSPILPIMGPRKSLWFADGQDHLRLRTPVDRALSGIDPHQLRSCVQRSATLLIDEFAADGTADLVSQYAARIPVMVLTQLFGCPDHLNGRISRAFLQMVNAVEPDAAQEGVQDLVACLTELIEIKHRAPGDDVTTRLLQHSADVTQEELIDQLVVITGAGQVPGTAWISTATMMLLSDDRFAGDLTGGNLTVTDALNEVLWLHAPHSNYSFVYAIEDYVLRDPDDGSETLIPSGVPVTISHAAANLDPALPTSQEQRAVNTAHLAFSAGPHACPAQDTAGVIAEVAIDTLLDRLPEMELAVPVDELTWRPGPFIRALTALPVRFAPAPATPTAPPGPGTPSGAAAPSGPPDTGPGPAEEESTVPPPQTPGTPGPPAAGSGNGRRRWGFAARRAGR